MIGMANGGNHSFLLALLSSALNSCWAQKGSADPLSDTLDFNFVKLA